MIPLLEEYMLGLEKRGSESTVSRARNGMGNNWEAVFPKASKIMVYLLFSLDFLNFLISTLKFLYNLKKIMKWSTAQEKLCVKMNLPDEKEEKMYQKNYIFSPYKLC